MCIRILPLCAIVCFSLSKPVFATSVTMAFQRISLWDWDVQPPFDSSERLASIDISIDWPIGVLGSVRYDDPLGQGYIGSFSVSANMYAVLESSIISQSFYGPFRTPDTLAVIPMGQTHADLEAGAGCVQHIIYNATFPITSGNSSRPVPSFHLQLIPLGSLLEIVSWSPPIPDSATASYVEFEVPYLSDAGTGTVTYNLVPEPSTLALLSIGLIGVICYARKHGKRS